MTEFGIDFPGGAAGRRAGGILAQPDAGALPDAHAGDANVVLGNFLNLATGGPERVIRTVHRLEPRFKLPAIPASEAFATEVARVPLKRAGQVDLGRQSRQARFRRRSSTGI